MFSIHWKSGGPFRAVGPGPNFQTRLYLYLFIWLPIFSISTTANSMVVTVYVVVFVNCRWNRRRWCCWRRCDGCWRSGRFNSIVLCSYMRRGHGCTQRRWLCCSANFCQWILTAMFQFRKFILQFQLFVSPCANFFNVIVVNNSLRRAAKLGGKRIHSNSTSRTKEPRLRCRLLFKWKRWSTRGRLINLALINYN